MMTLADHVQAGITHHRAGRLDDAAQEYGHVLTEDPSNVGVLRLMGILHTHRGDHEHAVMVLQAATSLEPGAPEILNDLGLALRGKRDFHAALDAFNDALRIQPAFAEAHFNKGVTLEGMGARTQAEDAYSLALRADPDLLAARFNRASILFATGRFERAAEDAGTVRIADPSMVNAHLLYGRASLHLGRLADAKNAFRAAIAHAPEHAGAHSLLGSVLTIEAKYEDAVRELTEALRLDPTDVQALYMLGLVHVKQYDPAAAHELLERAHTIQPTRPDITTALALTARRSGRLDDALTYLKNALTVAPDHADAHWHLADILLLRGEYEAGWEEFEWRWKHEGFLTPGWDSSEPAWNGGPIAGKSILLYPEQGYGDMFHFVRYAPLLAERGARVYVGAPQELADILASVPGISGVVTSRADMPACDVVSPLMSLPRLFGTRTGNVPASIPYLSADPDRVRAWAGRFPDDGVMRIGIIWSGNPDQENNRHRACHLIDMEPLFTFPNAHFYSLQKGKAAREIEGLTAGADVTDLSGGLTDFSETAAVLQHLDLLISTDTGPVHLAGALGRRVWLLVSAIPDWRWGVTGSRTPWYPTLTMFRQERHPDWSGAVSTIRNALDVAMAKQQTTNHHLKEG